MSAQTEIAELRGVASNLAGRMNWLIERIDDNDAQGIDTQDVKKKIRFFNAICESLGTVSTRWENLVSSMHAEFEANQQQLRITQADLDKNRVELEASQHELSEAQKRHDSKVEDLRRHRQKMDADWKITSQSQLTSHKLEESPKGLHVSNGSILSGLIERHDKKTEQLQQACEGRLMEIETELSTLRDQLDKAHKEPREAPGQLARNQDFRGGQDRLATVPPALQQKLIEQSSLQRRVDELQDQLKNVDEERVSHEETKALASELSLQIALGREDLRKALAERDQLKDTLAAKENSLESSRDIVKQLEARAGSKRQRGTPSSSMEDGADDYILPLVKRTQVDRAPSKSEREWHEKVEDLKGICYYYKLICPPEANISMGDSLAEFIRASDGDLSDALADFTSEAPAGTWYCFRQIADHCFDIPEALIKDDKCFIHKDKCFQIANARNKGRNSIYCRLKEYS
ncbi:hypothetical protein GQX73_g2737 [Xylaria multiplex]|uniref:Uncharacterized protein n=1 Tax=Xylaria multiplex TaxID=323545 RepID=A0A7C8IYE0_9PEZI|nr:hypothetical protein GQX73_g2737 [Xylaria multiplex]